MGWRFASAGGSLMILFPLMETEVGVDRFGNCGFGHEGLSWHGMNTNF